jgi:dolichol-phosphate mannosyltransferase
MRPRSNRTQIRWIILKNRIFCASESASVLSMKINIVIPAHNEEELIASTLCGIISCVKSPYRIIVVDDGSSDGTAAVVEKFQAGHPGIVVLLSQPHRGFAAAVKNGLRHVPEDEVFVFVMADGCDEPGLIDEMIRRIDRGADVVCASRYMAGGRSVGGRPGKSIGSRMVNAALVFLTKFPCHDATNSFKMFKKEALASLEIQSRGFEIFMELVLKICARGGRVIEMPTFWKERSRGTSHFHVFRHGPKYVRWLLFGFRRIR